MTHAHIDILNVLKEEIEFLEESSTSGSGSAVTDDEDYDEYQQPGSVGELDKSLEVNDVLDETSGFDVSKADDEDYVGTDDFPLILPSTESSPNYVDVWIESLEYYDEEDEISGDYDDDETRRKRSVHHEEDGDMRSIRVLLGLDDDDERIHAKEEKSFQTSTNYIKLDDLEACSKFKFYVQAVFPYQITVDSEEFGFETLCPQACDASDLMFSVSVTEETVQVHVRDAPDCVTNYSIKTCSQVQCSEEKFHDIDDDIIELEEKIDLCLVHNVQLTVWQDDTELVTLNQTHLFKSSFDSAKLVQNSINHLSSGQVEVSWMKPNDCVRGYNVTVYEIRHLPNLLPKYVDQDMEPIIQQTRLDDYISSLTLSNLSSCLLHKIEIRAVYKNDSAGNHY